MAEMLAMQEQLPVRSSLKAACGAGKYCDGRDTSRYGEYRIVILEGGPRTFVARLE